MDSIHLQHSPDGSFERLTRCPACSSDRLTDWVVGSDRLHRVSEIEFKYAICRACGLRFEVFRPSQAEMARYYPEDYAPHAADRKRSRSRLRKRLLQVARRISGDLASARKISRMYENEVSKDTVFLDFGCGSGKFLDRMRVRGAMTIGVDNSSQALAQVMHRGHEAIAAENFGTFSRKVNFVRMNHVLEHLYEPETVLRKIHEILEPGGRLHIAVPNPTGLSARLFGGAWHGLDCPRHVILFPSRSLSALLRTIGFRDIEVIPEPAAKDFLRSCRYSMTSRFRGGSSPNAILERPVPSIAGAVVSRLGHWLQLPDRYHISALK
jgi:2-polyprenyl-3-methyl-5-hydroxy-6-metoxy-1,4-benzoquinol methylase